jgi:flagellar capping protein FliD
VESGVLSLRQNSLTKQIASFAQQIAVKEASLSLYEEQQRIKFANLDGLLASLQNQLDALATLSSSSN